MADHSEQNAIHKAELEKKSGEALKEDLGIHDARMKKALETKEIFFAEKQDTLTHSNLQDHEWHANSKEAEDGDKDDAIKQDIHLHEERMESATHAKEELDAKKHADCEGFDRDIAKHQEKASLRHATASTSGKQGGCH